ncbi:MAG: glycosyltransferase family 87 protein [Acidocella sp.]|uniref:glycosyltransferase family 87 protein n=1 Tax=Acidocella sp. TaxID=50710 RepID=UPI003FD8D87F
MTKQLPLLRDGTSTDAQNTPGNGCPPLDSGRRSIQSSQRGVFSSPRGTALAIALCAFAPIVVIGIVQWILFKDGALGRFVLSKGLQISQISSVRETAVVLKHMATLAPLSGMDSWWPMHMALQVLGGAKKDVLYETLFFGEGVRFQYPPSSLLPLDLLTRMGLGNDGDFDRLNYVLFLINAMSMAFLAHFLASRLPLNLSFAGKSQARWAMPMIAFVATFLFYPAIRAVVLGQIQVWIDLLFTLACIAWGYGRRALPGAMIGACCAIKPQFALLLLWALVWREWIFATGVLVVAVPIALLSVAVYGLHNNIAYFDVLSFLSRHGESFYANNSVNGIINRYLGNGNNLRWETFQFVPFNPVVYGGTVCASVLAVAAIIAPALLRRGNATIFDFGAAVLLSVMGSPIAWEHHYGVMLPLYVFLLLSVLSEPASRSRSWRLAVLALSWFLSANLLSFTYLLADTRLNFLQANLFFGGLLLLPLLFIQARRTTRLLARS